MKKKNRNAAAYIVTAICVLATGALLYQLFVYGGVGQSTKFGFKIDNPSGTGFNRVKTVYTENGITNVFLTGKITVDGTAQIIVTANEDGSVVYSESYTNLQSKKLKFKVDGLTPYAYYTFSFISDNSKKGYLILESNESLVERPGRPERPDHSIPVHKN